MRKASPKMAWLLFNTGKNDREACLLVMSSGLPCEFLATGDEDTPKLILDYLEFKGLNEIQTFINNWQNNKSIQETT